MWPISSCALSFALSLLPSHLHFCSFSFIRDALSGQLQLLLLFPTLPFLLCSIFWLCFSSVHGKSCHQIYTNFCSSPATPKDSLFAIAQRGWELCFLGLSIVVVVIIIIVVAVLAVAFSYCRKLWLPDVGLCFQVCTGTFDASQLNSWLSYGSLGLRLDFVFRGFSVLWQVSIEYGSQPLFEIGWLNLIDVLLGPTCRGLKTAFK